VFTHNSTLAEAADWTLVATCACGHVGRLPCRWLGRQLRPDVRVGEIAIRLVCRACGAYPGTVELLDRIDVEAQGFGGGRARRFRILG
jgi:hypothetical protein